MSTLEDNIGIFSKAGIASEDKYNIPKDFNLIKIHKKISRYKDNFYPDKDWLDKLNGKNSISPKDIKKETNFDFEELNQEVKKNNIYYKQDEEKKSNIISNNINKENINKQIDNKKLLFKGKKYKYYNEHIQRINKYKNEGIYKAILKQQETAYLPKMDFIYKKIISGPKWETLCSRDLFNLNKINKNKTINITSIENKKNNKIKNKNFLIAKIKKIKSRNEKISDLRQLNKKNNTDIVNQFKTNINNINSNTNISTNNPYYSSLNNNNIKNNNNNIILTFDTKKNSLSLSDERAFTPKDKLLIINPTKILLKQNTFKNIISKTKYANWPDFKRSLDLEKIARKKKRLQKIPLSKVDLIPNYSSIEGNFKSFVNYKIKKVHLKRTKKFVGINTSEILYDPIKTFEKIYGNKMRSVPLFYKMKSRPSDINLPSFMKGMYSRLGLEISNDKTLKMNNYINSKMYRSQNFFGVRNNNYGKIRKIKYESDKELDKYKINKDLDYMIKQFNKIKPYDFQ